MGRGRTLSVKKGTYKRMTLAEKKLRKEFRDRLREEGVIPPVKKRLNRKKFSQEVHDELNEFGMYSDVEHLIEALQWMIPGGVGKINAEQVGVLKVLRLAMDIKEFKEEMIQRGETEYNGVGFYEEVVKPVIDL